MNREARIVRLSLAFLALAAFGAFGGTVLDVRDFGAVGDGVADDFAAIQRTLDRAEAHYRTEISRFASKGVDGLGTPEVRFPAGTYRISRPLLAQHTVTLVGEPGGVIALDDGVEVGLYLENAFRCTVRGLGFRGGVTHVCFWTANADTAAILIEGCVFEGAEKEAVWTEAWRDKAWGSIGDVQEQQDELHDVGPYDVTRDGDGLPVLTRAVRQYGSANSTRFCFRDCRVSGCGAVFRGSCDGVYARRVSFESARVQSLPVWKVDNAGRLVDLTIRANIPQGYDRAWFETSNPNFDMVRIRAESTSGFGAPLFSSNGKPASEDMWGVAHNVRIAHCTAAVRGSPSNAFIVFHGCEPALLTVVGCREASGRLIDLIHFDDPPRTDADLARTVCSGEQVVPRLTHRWAIGDNAAHIAMNLPASLRQCLECPIPEAALGDFPALDAPVADPSSGPYEDFDAADYGVTLESSESDASSRLQSLFDAAAKSANPRVLLPGRTILIARPVTIPRKVRIVGEGRSIIRSLTKDHALLGVADGDAPLAVSFDNVGLVWGDIAVEAAGAGAILFRNGVLIGNCGFKVAARGGALALDAVDTTVYSPRFVESDGADVRLKDSWTEFTPRGGCSSLYLIRGGSLLCEGVLGVPIAGGDPFVWPRIGSLAEDEYVFWIRNEGGVVRTHDYRFGGEFGGFPALDQYGAGKALLEMNFLSWGNPSGLRRTFRNESAEATVVFDHVSLLGLGNAALAFGVGERPGTLVIRGSRLEKCDFEDGEDFPLADFCENCYNTYMHKVHNSKQGDHPMVDSLTKLVGCGCAAALTAFAAYAETPGVPTVDAVSIVHRDGARYATVGYTLSGAAAIVTVDIQTNGVSIGAANFAAGLSGDVNKVVETGPHEIKWDTRATWPEQKTGGAVLRAVVTAWTTSFPPDYMVLDLEGSKAKAYYASADEVPFGVSNDIYKTSKLLMRKIPAMNRTFVMGSPAGEVGRDYWEYGHLVTLSNDFWLGVYPVTQAQHKKVMGSLPDACLFTDKADSDLRPVNGCSFAYIRGNINDNNKRNFGYYGGSGPLGKFSALTGATVDFPTEAQWEFACRAGSQGAIYTGGQVVVDDSGRSAALDEIAWYAGNAGGESHPVGLKKPNGYGLYDMLGNVCETYLDWWRENLGTTPVIEPFWPSANGNGGVARRGGSYALPAAKCRSAARNLARTSWHTLKGNADWGTGDADYTGSCGYRLAVEIK